MNNEDFKKIVEKYEKLVFTICFQLVRDYQEAQNLTQETFISAYTHINSCNMESIKPWLGRIATNKAKDYLKSAYNRRVQLNEDGQDNENIISLSLTPENEIISQYGAEYIKEKIYSLKEPYHKVSVMYFIEEMTTQEIANKLNRPKKTVQTQLLRAKVILQKILKEG